MKYYAVKQGRKPGIYTDWESCRAQVDGYSCAEYKSFPSETAAREYMTGESKAPDGQTVAYVDGSFNVKTGEYAYGAVMLENGEISTYSAKFSDAEMADMRNVAGEIKGAEFVMRLCIEKGIKRIRIVYDYVGIEAWATGAWKANKPGTQAYKRYYDSIKSELFVDFEKVKGHSGDKYNDIADSLAKSALGIS